MTESRPTAFRSLALPNDHFQGAANVGIADPICLSRVRQQIEGSARSGPQAHEMHRCGIQLVVPGEGAADQTDQPRKSLIQEIIRGHAKEITIGLIVSISGGVLTT